LASVRCIETSHGFFQRPEASYNLGIERRFVMRVRTLTVAWLLSLLGPAAAVAGNPCIGEARQQALECVTQCREDLQIARDGCLNRDHECVELCRAERGVCVEATGLEAALDQCNDVVRAAKQTCRSQDLPSVALDQCIDQAQVVGFQCRDAAREAARPALEACQEAFAGCARACPPADPAGEVVNPRQCRRDAKTAHKACKATCREGLQFQKDACRNRDHDCVEQCRTERDVCREPVETDLESRATQCRTDRDAAVQNCRALFADGTAEQDQCIDNAQVAAFQCGDAAREAVRPGFVACSDGFRTCAEACPPVAP
jgi:hypothetical protein